MQPKSSHNYDQVSPLNHVKKFSDPQDHQHNVDRSQNIDQNHHYFQEYCRLYKTAYSLSDRFRQLISHRQNLMQKLTRFQKKTDDFKDDIRGEPTQKKKRNRKPAQQINRNYICTVQRCERAYGSQGSLKQHIKLKHPQLYQSKSSDRFRNSNESEPSINQ